MRFAEPLQKQDPLAEAARTSVGIPRMGKPERTRRVLILAAYAIAMALVEAAAVVYLRELSYPSGFLVRSAADLRAVPAGMLKIEVLREVATLVMLASVSYLAYVTLRARLIAFLFTFSLWDVGYYLFLYLFLRWPLSLTTQDVYFLIPWPWIGPVWFPLLLFSGIGVVSLRLLLYQTPPVSAPRRRVLP